MKIEFSATSRTLQGTGASRRLRRNGRVPGILYGGDKPAQTVELDHKDFFLLLRQEAFHSSILTMKLDGKPEQVVLKDVQMHPFKQSIMHVDFLRIAKDHKIHVKVPLHFVNAEIAPGVKLSGGVVNHVLSELEIICLPDDLPEFIEVDLGQLTAGHSIHLSEISLPRGVEPVLHRGDDPVVATIQVPKAHAAEEEAVPEAAAAAAPAPAPTGKPA